MNREKNIFQSRGYISNVCVCACACMRASVCACVHACVGAWVCVRVHVLEIESVHSRVRN